MQGNQGCSDGGCSSAGRDRQGRTKAASNALEKVSLPNVRDVVLVLSGKGGVGKSTVAVGLAASLAERGMNVGLLDVDIHGPSVPIMLGLSRKDLETESKQLRPVQRGGMKVMSLGLLLPDDDSAVIWRGPMKMGVIRQLLDEVEWGDLDVLVIDCPPGTGDEPLSLAQILPHITGAIVVTTPQQVALIDVRKSMRFCEHLDVPVMGVVENMSGFVCPHCGETSDVFSQGGGIQLAEQMGVPCLARIPIDPSVVASADSGRWPASGSDGAAAGLQQLVTAVEGKLTEKETAATTADSGASNPKEGSVMRIAIPAADGMLCMHFGHCQAFELIDVDPETKQIVDQTSVEAPEHQPGLLPPWLSERGVNLVIAGGMGQRAQQLFVQHGVQVMTGAPAQPPRQVVESYLNGTLTVGDNICDH